MGLLFSRPKDNTFLSQAKNTGYGRVLKRPMKFTIYLDRGGLSGHFHDRIVLASEERYGYITFELSLNDKKKDKKIVPKCEKFEGNVQKLQRKKELVCTLKGLADDATVILHSMDAEGYNVITNNCQNFCNHFLKKVDAKPYMTTPFLLAAMWSAWKHTHLPWGRAPVPPN